MNSGGTAGSTQSGHARAALFLASLDDHSARALLRHLPASTAATLQRELEETGAAPPGTGAQLLEELNGFGDSDFAFEVASEVVSEHKLAAEEEERSATPVSGAGEPGAPAFSHSGAEELARLLQSEHPQTVACVLSRLAQDRAGTILSNLPAAQASEIVRRMADIGPVSPQAAERMTAALERRLTAPDRGEDASATVRAAAGILRSVAPPIRNEIADAIKRDDPALAARLQDIDSPPNGTRGPQDRAAGHGAHGAHGGPADDR